MSPPSAISEYDSPSSCSWSLNYALLETGADTVCRSKESAHEPLMVLALLPQAVRSICCWTSVRAVDTLVQHHAALRLCHATVRWCGTAAQLSYFDHSLP